MTLTDHPPADPFSPDLLYDVLSNRRRRHVLDCLAEEPGAVAFEELVDRVASRESTDPISTSPSVRTSLYHVHLPKLTDGGFLEYDPDRRLVRPTEAAAGLRFFSRSDRSVAE